MLKCARGSLKFHHLRTLYTRSSPPPNFTRPPRTPTGVIVASAVITVVGYLGYTTSNIVYNDSHSSESVESREPLTTPVGKGRIDNRDSEILSSVVWGSNKSNVISPDTPNVDSVRTPAVVTWLENVALRDLSLHETHAACVDARGDVYQWGDGFSGLQKNKTPALTLRGKNITHLQLTESRLFALAASGKVYALSTHTSEQELQTVAPSASTSWWDTVWNWGKEETAINFAEITPEETLKRGEKFVSIAAGNDHLLALTSAGRTYTHPITRNANTYGQLGLSKFDIPDLSSTHPKAALRLAVELIPKSIADPYAKASPFTRAPPSSPPSDNTLNVDDKNNGFCDKLFEVPSLKGLEVAQVSAGERSSYVRTSSGNVLGWGANEYGQVGLGSNVTLDTITVPSQVTLWRSALEKTQTRCLNIFAGGNLTCFVVERVDEPSAISVDLLMCGNGQWGGLGNNVYSNAQGTPIRAKSVSGLVEYCDETKRLEPIPPYAVSISPTGHVLLTLNTSTSGGGGRDLLVWGRNYDSELGNGKKTSLPVPTTLSTPDGGRFMLMSRKAKEVRDLEGRIWKRDVKVEQSAVAGYGNSVVYWKIC